MAAPDFYNVAPDCIQHGLPPGNPFSPENAAPYEQCTGFFTFGAGKVYGGAAGHPVENLKDVGLVLTNPSAGLLTITVIGIIVMVLAFVAWVWFEHRKLMDRANKLRAAGTPPHVGGPHAG